MKLTFQQANQHIEYDDGEVHEHFLTAYVDGHVAYVFGGFKTQRDVDVAKKMFTAGFKVAQKRYVAKEEYTRKGQIVSVKT